MQKRGHIQLTVTNPSWEACVTTKHPGMPQNANTHNVKSRSRCLGYPYTTRFSYRAPPLMLITNAMLRTSRNALLSSLPSPISPNNPLRTKEHPERLQGTQTAMHIISTLTTPNRDQRYPSYPYRRNIALPSSPAVWGVNPMRAVLERRVHQKRKSPPSSPWAQSYARTTPSHLHPLTTLHHH